VLLAEPETAACVLASLTAGRLVTVPTAATVMAGLNCGTASSSAWPVLRAGCDAAVAVSDDEALRAADDLGRLGVSSGPSGAAALAAVRAALTDVGRRAALDLGDDAVVVLLSTEGRTR
jgi:diaminopropionate ammonia-lyase